MASISTSAAGLRTIQFMATDGKRRTIRLGKVPMKTAEEVSRRVEHIVGANGSDTSIDRETVKWLTSIGDDLHRRFAAVGLAVPRERPDARLGGFIDHYIAGRKDAKRGTINNLRMFGDRLIAFFGADKDMGTIKLSDADAWSIHLKAEYAAGTWGRTIKGARQLFKAAVRAEIISRNPFEDLKAGSHIDKNRQCFITHEDAQRVIAACPDAEWRLIVALSRYGGLRCPSEHLALTWADVDWERSRFRVNSPKTGERWVPIFAELRPYLEEVFDSAPVGAVAVITCKRDSNQNLRTRFMKIIRRAGLAVWPKPFHNLRASRQTELAALYPMKAVCEWIGNSAAVAEKHYLQTTEDDFERAAKSGAVALQKPVQHTAASGRTDPQESSEHEDNCEVVRIDASRCGVNQYAPRDSNPQPMAP
jgi:integrase